MYSRNNLLTVDKFLPLYYVIYNVLN